MATHFETLLRTLEQYGVDFIVVGGVAAVLQGAPVTTFDLDALFAVTPENARKAEQALKALEARYRERQDLAPTVQDLMAGGHMLLQTVGGPLDLLGFIGDRHTYEEFVESSDSFTIGDLNFQVLSLSDLIQTKRETGRDKDIAMLEVLLELQRRR